MTLKLQPQCKLEFVCGCPTGDLMLQSKFDTSTESTTTATTVIIKLPAPRYLRSYTSDYTHLQDEGSDSVRVGSSEVHPNSDLRCELGQAWVCVLGVGVDAHRLMCHNQTQRVTSFWLSEGGH